MRGWRGWRNGGVCFAASTLGTPGGNGGAADGPRRRRASLARRAKRQGLAGTSKDPLSLGLTRCPNPQSGIKGRPEKTVARPWSTPRDESPLRAQVAGADRGNTLATGRDSPPTSCARAPGSRRGSEDLRRSPAPRTEGARTVSNCREVANPLSVSPPLSPNRSQTPTQIKR